MNAVHRRVLSRYAVAVVLLAGLMAVLLPSGEAHAVATYSISGKVTLGAGAPSAWLKGVSVSAYSTTDSTYAYNDVDPATGTYSITGLKSGTYRLHFDVRSYYDSGTTVYPNLVDEYYNDSLSRAGAAIVTVGSSNVTNKNATLAVGRTISGKVMLPAGFTSAALEAVSVSASSDTDYGYAQVDPATGNYTVVGISPGSYSLLFSVSSYLDYDTWEFVYPNLVSEYFNNSLTLAGATDVNVTTGDRASISATLAQGHTISGKVTLPAGAPAAWLNGVRVWADSSNTSKIAHVDPATGNYTVTGLDAGSYTLEFAVSSYYDAGTSTTVTPNLKSEYFDNAATHSAATKIAVSSSNVTGKNVALDYAVASTFTTVPQPTVTGTVALGSTLTANKGTWVPAATAYEFQWYRDRVAVSGATKANYKIVAADAGTTLTVKVTGSRSGYTTAAKSSPWKKIPPAFTKTATPTITGTGTVASVLTVNTGTWTPVPTKFSYQWYSNGTAISGAVNASYKVRTGDSGKNVTVKVTAIKSGYLSTPRASAAKAIA